MMRHSLRKFLPLLVILVVMITLTVTLAQIARFNHAALAKQLYELQDDHAMLANEVLLARGGRRPDYQALVQAADRVRRSAERLSEQLPESAGDFDANLRTSVSDYIDTVSPLLGRVEAFKTANAVEHNSLHSLSALADEVVALTADSERHVVAAVEKLLREVLVYSVDGSIANQTSVGVLLRQLQQMESKVSRDVASVLALIVSHVAKLLEVRPQLDQHLDAIIASPAGQALTQTMMHVADLDAQNARTQRLLQFGLIMASASLLGYVGTTLWQLRRAVRELDAANSMLEQTIEARAAELKLQGQQLHQAQKLESIGQLAAGIAHEINTPMQFVHDNVEFLSDCSQKLFAVIDAYQRNLDTSGPNVNWNERAAKVAQATQSANFELIHREAPIAIEESLEGIRRVIHIVRAMKEFSHPGQENRIGVDLNNAVKSTITIARNRWKYAADLELDLDPDLPTLRCVPADINQVLLNLIVNAADAIAEKHGENSGQKGRITVRTRRDRDEIIVEVADTGCGIPDTIRNRIFDPFFTTKDVGKGTGQGLAICYNVIVTKLEGSISVESTPGQGTRFRITIPIYSPLAAATRESGEPIEQVEAACDDNENGLID
jgi:signal transduction histidine kinase